MAMTSTSENSEWRDGFLFLGNHIALDFLNTRPVQNGERVELLPDFPALVRWFRAAGLLGSQEAERLQQQWAASVRAVRTVEVLRDLRERLRKAILAWERGETVNGANVRELNRLMEAHPMLHRLKATATPNSVELWFAPNQPEDLFAPLAYSAARLFAEADHNRVRKCGNCVLHFQDTSKKGTRRWCSMRLCGNRFKVAAYAARRRRPK